MRPLYPNPGGRVDPDDLVGRHAELQRLHEAIVHSGAHVTGERRMGKTSILNKLHDELDAAGRTVIRLSAETQDLTTFTYRLLNELRTHKLVSRRISKWEKEIGGEISVSILGSGIKLTGKAKKNTDQTLELDLVDLLTSTSETAGAVLIIDEITVLCAALGPDATLEFLGNLRAHRESPRPLALVISGSLGLHHVLSDTRPINDLWTVEVAALQDAEARELIARLLLGVGITRTDALEHGILCATGGIPFYIQAVVQQLVDSPTRSISDIVEQSIIENLWHTEHYVTRLGEYLGDDAAMARAMLDEYATHDLLRVDDLERMLSTTFGPTADRENLLRVMSRLQKDHYVVRADATTSSMSSPLLQQIWRIHRQLG